MEPRQTPTYEANVPEDLSGDGGMACELATAYFGDPLPWQPHLLDAMLARDARDKYLLRTLGISIPRQVLLRRAQRREDPVHLPARRHLRPDVQGAVPAIRG